MGIHRTGDPNRGHDPFPYVDGGYIDIWERERDLEEGYDFRVVGSRGDRCDFELDLLRRRGILERRGGL
jgi:hypothetical protein